MGEIEESLGMNFDAGSMLVHSGLTEKKYSRWKVKPRAMERLNYKAENQSCLNVDLFLLR